MLNRFALVVLLTLGFSSGYAAEFSCFNNAGFVDIDIQQAGPEVRFFVDKPEMENYLLTSDANQAHTYRLTNVCIDQQKIVAVVVDKNKASFYETTVPVTTTNNHVELNFSYDANKTSSFQLIHAAHTPEVFSYVCPNGKIGYFDVNMSEVGPHVNFYVDSVADEHFIIGVPGNEGKMYKVANVCFVDKPIYAVLEFEGKKYTYQSLHPVTSENQKVVMNFYYHHNDASDFKRIQ